MRSCAAAVAVLLINDRILKYAFPGVITGKLSDFAGLFALAVLAGSLVPSRAGRICAAIGIAFVVWKSPLADPFIAFWNAHSSFQIARVKDWTDLIALIVLPFAARVRIAPRRMRDYAFTTVFSAVAIFAFAATSFANYRILVPEGAPLREIHVKAPRSKIESELKECGLLSRTIDSSRFVVEMPMDVDGKKRTINLDIDAVESPAETKLFIELLGIYRQTDPPRDEKLIVENVQNRIVSCLKPLGIAFGPREITPIDQPLVRFEGDGPKRPATIIVLRRNGNYVEHRCHIIENPDHSLTISANDPDVIARGLWWRVNDEIVASRDHRSVRYRLEHGSLILDGRFDPARIELPMP